VVPGMPKHSYRASATYLSSKSGNASPNYKSRSFAGVVVHVEGTIRTLGTYDHDLCDPVLDCALTSESSLTSYLYVK
jgi:hypothetical protein